MDLYNRIANVRKMDYEAELVDAIAAVRKDLNGLDITQMCKVYNGYLLKELTRRHIPSRIINTKDLGINYEHVFLLVIKDVNSRFLADLTFEQFGIKNEEFKQLLSQGYQLVDGKSLNEYLNVVSCSKTTKRYLDDELFYR